jgi:hypothetical protein
MSLSETEAHDVSVHLLEQAMNPPEYRRLVPHHLVCVANDG